MEQWLFMLLGIAVVSLASFFSFRAGISNRKKFAEAEIGSAEQEAKRIMNEAVLAAEAKKKAIILEGKDEVHKLRTETEKELADRRRDMQKQEKRILHREETLDKKLDSVELIIC